MRTNGFTSALLMIFRAVSVFCVLFFSRNFGVLGLGPAAPPNQAMRVDTSAQLLKGGHRCWGTGVALYRDTCGSDLPSQFLSGFLGLSMIILGHLFSNKYITSAFLCFCREDENEKVAGNHR